MRAMMFAGLTAASVLLAGCDSNSVPVDGTVVSVAYKCRYDIQGDDARALAERAKRGDTPTDAEMFGDCSSDPDFLAARADFDANKTRFSGKAKVRVSFISPVDNSSVDGEVEFDGDDREFYTLRNGSPIPLMVNKTDHSRIRFGG